MGFFDNLFDFNGDGKEDTFEKTVGWQMIANSYGAEKLMIKKVVLLRIISMYMTKRTRKINC